MSIARPNLFRFSDSILLKALIISVVVHLTLFGTWKWGQAHGWWKHIILPSWMQLASKKALAQMAKNNPPKPPRETPLLFVDVDPSLATVEPPKNAKFYGAANAKASSTEKKIESDLPQIQGTQDKILKSTENSKSKAQPLQPSPPKLKETDTAEAEPKPKPTDTPGDLAIAKPREKTQTENGQAESEKRPSEIPVHTKPRTVAEAKRKAGMAGEKMKHEGGGHLAMSSSFDVKRTASGDYDRDFIDAVQERWFKLLEDRDANRPGKVVLEFRLHYDGRITDMKTTENEVGDLLGFICQKAVLDPAPYNKWPADMRREIGADFRDVKFTFYYLTH